MRNWSQNSYNQQYQINAEQNILLESIETQHYDQENINSLIKCEVIVQDQPSNRLDYDLTQPKNQKNKQQKVVQALSSTRINEQFVDEEIQSQNQSAKNSLQLLSKRFLHSQEIIVNEQFKNNVQIYLRENRIQDKNVRKIILSHIIGNIDQIVSLGCEQELQKLCIPLSLNNDCINFRNHTVQNMYQYKKETYSVSVKTFISEDNQQFIVQKMISKVSDCSSQEFKNSVKSEIENLEYIESKKTQVTLPFIDYQFSENEFGQERCILRIVSGLKNLVQVQKYYQCNKQYEEFNTILEFAFCQLLSKLNQMHRICQIAHSDIKPQNIVVGYDLQFYFIDFGTSIYLDDKEQFQYYLSGYTFYYNLDIFKQKREKMEWKYLEIIDCDTSQLILTFLKMFDVEDNYYQDLIKDFSIENKNKYKQLLMPEFKRKVRINDDNIRSELFNEIFGNLDQFDSHIADENDNLNVFTPLLLDLHNQLDFRKCRTVQKLYYHQKGTCTVSVKICISKNYQKFIVQKIIINRSQQYSQEFKNSVQIEIDMLNKIQSKKIQVTLPFIVEPKFRINKFGQEKYILRIESGIKNLEQVKKYYQNNKKYEEFNTILEFAFCQLLSKLNQMHKICQIAHSDINPQNIVVGYDLQFYFIDFGESVYLEDENSCKQYLKSNSQDYSLNIFLEKKEWKYQEIIDCDTSQLILTFLKMFDVEEKFYQELRSLKNEMKYYKKLLMPEFKRLGNYLIDSIQHIYQNHS
ncbi:hypothetical protein ABPG72_022352, partial [Tetrahymena utriculariae]